MSGIGLGLHERHLAVFVHIQLAVHIVLCIHHRHFLIRYQRCAQRLKLLRRNLHVNSLLGQHVGVVTGHAAFHSGQIGTFYPEADTVSILVIIAIRHGHLQRIVPIRTAVRQGREKDLPILADPHRTDTGKGIDPIR